VNYNDLVWNNWGFATGTWDLYSNSAGEVSFAVYDGASQYTAYGCAAAFTLNEWHYVVGTYDGSTVKVYLDSNLCENTAAISGLTLSASGPVRIGEPDGGGASTHYIDEVRVYNSVIY